MTRKFNLFIILFLLSAVLNAQDIDLSHWKVTIPASRPDNPNKPLEVAPPEILDFENNEALAPYFYRDPKDQAIVFHAYPAKSFVSKWSQGITM